MKFIEPKAEIIKGLPPLQKIALIARVCTGTQDKAETTPEAALAFCKKLIGMGHYSPFEHARITKQRIPNVGDCVYPRLPYGFQSRVSFGYKGYSLNVRDFLAIDGTLEEAAECEEAEDYLTVCFTVDIGIARELIRHRSMSFMERSTRWCSWSEENGGIEFIKPEVCHENPDFEWICKDAFTVAERRYFLALSGGVRREMARSVLPLATATKLYVTGTYQHWTWLLNLRLGKRAHPAMRRIMNQLIEQPDFPKNEMPIKEAAN